MVQIHQTGHASVANDAATILSYPPK